MSTPRRVLRLWPRGRVSADVQEEFAFHLEMRTRKLIADGLSVDDAKAEAARQFGDVLDATRYCRTTGERRERRIMRTEWLSGLQQDVAFAWRTLRKAPGFTVVVVVTLAIAVGATTAVFSMVNGVLLKPLPFPHAEQLVRVGSIGRRSPKLTAISYPDFVDYRDQSRLVPQLSLVDQGTRNLTVRGSEPVRVNAVRVSTDFFDILEQKPEAGRLLIASDAQAAAPSTAVLSDRLWRERFAADPALVGRAIVLDGLPVTVVGIAPATLAYPRTADLWITFRPDPSDLDPRSRGAHYLDAIGRLAPGATAAAAQIEMHAIAARLSASYPRTNAEFSAGAVDLREWTVGDVRLALQVMLGCVACLLLIACANIANLLLIRAAGRESEIAVRTALGAGTTRLVRQLVTESLMLAVAGAVTGTVIAVAIIGVVKRAGPRGVPRLADVVVDQRVLLFTALVALVTGLIFGLVPALYAVRSDIGGMLKSGARGSSVRRGSRRIRSALVAAEVALALVLLIGAGLLTRTFVRLTAVDTGFNSDHIVTASMSLPNDKYPWDHQVRLFGDNLLQRVRHLPGVDGAALVYGRPLDENGMRIIFNRDDTPPTPVGHPNTSDVRVATPDFFRVMGVRLVAGRTFNDGDRPGHPLALVVSQEFVKKYYPKESPLGKHITFGWTRDTSAADQNVPVSGEIVGVVADVRQHGPSSDAPAATYMSFTQVPMQEMSIVAHASGGAIVPLKALQAQVRAIDPEMPVFNVTTMTAALSETVAQPRFYAILLASFAAVALLLAALGIYGVIAYSVAQRTRELGIRVALGAGRSTVVGMVLRQGVTLTATGVVIGLGAAIGLTRLMATLLFGVTPLDTPTFVAVTSMLIAVSIAATWIPAVRAARVDPLVAMRGE